MLSQAIKHLIQQDRFYAEFIQLMDRKITTAIPTAAIVTGTRLTLEINPDFWKTLDLTTQVGVLKHECLHVLSEHVARVRRYSDWQTNHKFYNICMDLAINCLIPEIPRLAGYCTVEDMHAQGFTNLKKDESFEYYVDYFRQDAEAAAKAVRGDKSDEHKFSNDTPQEVIDSYVRHAAKQAAEACERAGVKPSNEVVKLLPQLFHTKNQWRREVQKFPQDAETCDFESTRKRRNRRFGLDFPGTKPVRKVSLMVGVDVSGSMFNEETLKALGVELAKVIDAGAEVHAVFFDADITDYVKMSSASDILKYNHKGGGGTLFRPVFERAKEMHIDGLIMLTDTYNADADVFHEKWPFPVLWGVIGANVKSMPIGKVVHVDAAA